jgi:hypothetical protein
MQILLWGLLGGRRHWRTWCIHGLFHLFKVGNLGEMMIIMSILTAKRAREVLPEVVVDVPPLAFVFIAPLGVLVTLILVSPTCWFCWGLFPPGPRLLLFQFFPLFLALFD